MALMSGAAAVASGGDGSEKTVWRGVCGEEQVARRQWRARYGLWLLAIWISTRPSTRVLRMLMLMLLLMLLMLMLMLMLLLMLMLMLMLLMLRRLLLLLLLLLRQRRRRRRRLLLAARPGRLALGGRPLS